MSLFPDSSRVPVTAAKAEFSELSSVSFGEYTVGDRSTEAVVFAHSVIFLNRVEDVCVGAIGVAGKVCLQLRGKCPYFVHVKRAVSGLQSELCVKTGSSEC